VIKRGTPSGSTCHGHVSLLRIDGDRTKAPLPCIYHEYMHFLYIPVYCSRDGRTSCVSMASWMNELGETVDGERYRLR
jgi:hypothetical protein